MLSEELVIVRDWLRELSGLDLEDVVADSGITAGMVVQHEARGMAARLDRALDAAREEGRQSPRPLPVGVEEVKPVRKTMCLTLTDAEQAALDDLVRRQQLEPPKIFRQALKLYQLHCLGFIEVRDRAAALSPLSDGGGA